jgi:hypothetical protein
MLCLGIDPDMHDLAIASWDDLGPVAAHVVSIPKKLTGTDALLAMMHELSKPWPEFGRPELRDDCMDRPDWCAVEGQEARQVRGQYHHRPEDLMKLASVAGMAVMRVARGYLHGCGLYWPKPSEWKGQVEKHAMQARLYDELGWGYEIVWKNQKAPIGRSRKGDYAYPKTCPDSFADINREQWKHCGDALLLARWCWEQASGRPWRRVG